MGAKKSRAVDHQISNTPVSFNIDEVYQDFILSRRAKYARPKTLKYYHETAERFAVFLQEQGLNDPAEIAARHVRAYLHTYVERGCKPNYVNGQARGVRAFLRFLHEESYIPKEVKFEMPPVGKERQLVLNEEQVEELLKACNTKRDIALVAFMVDSGMRAEEVLSMNWENIDLTTGTIFLQRGKGGKSRSTAIGAYALRLLMAYRRAVDHAQGKPLFQSETTGQRLTYYGLRLVFTRLSKRSGIKVTAHALRRTFATMMLKQGVNVIYLQGLMGHADLDTTRMYTRLEDSDLIEAHHAHGPLDHIRRK